MHRLSRLLVVVFLLLAFAIPVAPAAASTVAAIDMTPYPGCETGVFGTGATWLICMPERFGIPDLRWNGDLVIFVHGYVSPYPERAPEIPADQTAQFPGPLNAMGYAFATTSFRTNGLAVKDGVADVVQLLGQFKELHPLTDTGHTYLLGFSEGGLITTLAIEQKNAQFAGGVAACGPIGDFGLQIDHTVDMRVVFDYYFKTVESIYPLPPTALDIPGDLMEYWDSFKDAEPPVPDDLLFELVTHPDATAQVLGVTKTPYDENVPGTAILSVAGVLWYNIFGSNDAIAKMGGIPYDNTNTTYVNPFYPGDPINNFVERYSADRNALAQLNAQYQTSGRLKSPLVTMHNTGDPIVPYAHEELYAQKVKDSGSTGFYVHFNSESDLPPAVDPIAWYGHCQFTPAQVLYALEVLEGMSLR